MNTRRVSILILLPLVLTAQALRDVAPLKYWPAPLYWQPTHEENRLPGRSELFSVNVATPAQTPANSLVFVAITPCRLVDTRAGFGFTGAFGPPSLAGSAARSFPIQTSTTCTVPAVAQAYSLNVTVVPQGTLTYLTAWPSGTAQPNASTLNDTLGSIVANAAIIRAGSDGSGSVSVFVSNNTDLIVDINGYYAAQSGITLVQGAAGAPSLSFAADPATGIYSAGTGILNFAVAGISALSVGGSNSNTALGVATLVSETTGVANAATGYHALIGNTSGSANTAFGYGALASNTTGGSNVAVGADSLLANSTGSNNIAIGTGAGLSVSGSGSNNIYIGHGGTSADGNTIRIGTPGSQTSFFAAGIRGFATGLNNAVPVLIDSAGQLGTANSSHRFKEDVQDMASASSGLLQLRPVTYRYKEPYSDGSKPLDYGLIAEEVAEVYPDLVVRNTDGQVETVQYQKLTPMLLNELQKQHERGLQQQKQIAEQQDQIAEQQELNRKLADRLAAIEARLPGSPQK